MTDPGPDSGIPLGIYRGSSVDISFIEAYEQFLSLAPGSTVGYVLAYMADNPSWPQFEAAVLAATTNGAAGTMTATAWAPVLGGRTLVLSVPACCQGTIWADEASGKNDAHWLALTRTLVQGGLKDCHLRIAREFTGTWYRWHATPATATAYSDGYSRICKLMRDNGFTGEFIWNPYIGLGSFAASGWPAVAKLFPEWGNGNIGLDFYDGPSTHYPPGETARTEAQQLAAWNDLLTQPGGLNDWRALAVAKKKAVCYPEWGLRLWNDASIYRGGGDNPVLIREMAGWLKDTQPYMHAFWEDANAGVFDPDWTPRRLVAVPASRAEFLRQFAAHTTA